MRLVRSAGTASLLVESIAASAASGFDALHAAHPLWERTTATNVAKGSNPKPQTLLTY
jgi:hypothetical protein